MNPDFSRVGYAYVQGIRAEDGVVYLNVLITQQMSDPGAPMWGEKAKQNTVDYILHFWNNVLCRTNKQ